MKKFYVLLALVGNACFAFSQYTLQGKVTDFNGESLIGANVILNGTYRGTATNLNGLFKFTDLKSGNYQVMVSYLGFQTYSTSIDLNENVEINVKLSPDIFLADEIVVSATRVKSDMPVAHYNIDKEQIENKNMGQDIPSILKLTPSFVSSSDAGTGIGYSSFRIRGSDLERINVTINGIPLNDAESHGVWWVDLPDFASSTENIQIQRGIGASSNGAGAFGATINLQTSGLKKDPYADYDLSFGSFNSLRNTVSFGTGLLKDKFTFDARLSKITSDGFIDRAWSDLKSFYLSGAYYTSKDILKFNIFSGIEETYQAWNGVPKVRLENDAVGMQRYEDHGLYTPEQASEMRNSDSRTYNLYTYDNEIDHYEQSHYQLHYSRELLTNLVFNTSLHYTRGLGYYEQFKTDDDFSDYNLNDVVIGSDTITSTDLIRRKWLDNHFYGLTYSLIYNKKSIDFSLGGGFHKYDGDHYGKIIWSEFASNGEINYEWYRSNGLKQDYNVYAKLNYKLTDFINLFGDLQYRHINYEIKGIDDDLVDISLKSVEFDFFNPKAGIFYKLTDRQDFYFSIARGNREPKRGDYIHALKKTNKSLPTSETLVDYELGFNHKSTNFRSQINLYYMDYKNQLVQTGEINDVGDALSVNVDKSYRRGIELITMVKLSEKIMWNFNFTLSQNKIPDFTEYIDNWDYWYVENEPFQYTNKIGTTDISFSPNIIGGSNIIVEPFNDFSISLTSKYVGKQYIDNTSNDERSLDPYFVNDLAISYQLNDILFKEIKFKLSVYNLLDEEYETSAWVYRYYTGKEHYTMDGYFPQAGRHIMAGINIGF